MSNSLKMRTHSILRKWPKILAEETYQLWSASFGVPHTSKEMCFSTTPACIAAVNMSTHHRKKANKNGGSKDPHSLYLY